VVTTELNSNPLPVATASRLIENRTFDRGGDRLMSVYKLIEIIGTSNTSWEDAAVSAVKTARQTLRDLRVAEVIEQDMDLTEGDEITFRTKLRVSFRFEGD
jgi:flavin-binding protein dodecin